MNIDIADNARQMGRRAAECGASILREAIDRHGEAHLVMATGASQLRTLESLVAEPDIDWSKVSGFHLDEYIGLSVEHPASFRRYLAERFVHLVPLRDFYYVDGENDPEAECRRLEGLIENVRVDLAFVGIGENAHLAFNDPPADFQTDRAYRVVHLDEACRKQQCGEGWFASPNDVPNQAISMSVRQILRAEAIVCSVPDRRKAEAVRKSVEGPVTPDVPASALQQHPNAFVFLDRAAAERLTVRP